MLANIDRQRRLAFAPLLLLGWLLGAVAPAGAMTIEQVFTKYRGIAGFKADLVQTKTSPLLLRPLTTKVALTLKDGTITWAPAGQKPFEMAVPAAAGQAGKGAPATAGGALGGGASGKLERTLATMQDLITLSPRLHDDFSLTVNGGDLVATPRPGRETGVFQRIVLTFAPAEADLPLRKMRFETADDVTELVVASLVIDRQPSAKPKAD